MARILIAENDDSMRNFLVRSLKRAGHEVEAVSTGLDALPHVASQTYDVLLTDIVMPELDGLALAKRAGRLAPKTKVVFITGFAAVALHHGEKGEKKRSKLLSKPFHLRDVAAAMDKLCVA